MSSVIWPSLRSESNGRVLTIRVATRDDVRILEAWDREPGVIACATDKRDAVQAFAGARWTEEVDARSEVSCYHLAELDGRPLGALQVIDPQREPTHYWGEIEPNPMRIQPRVRSGGVRFSPSNLLRSDLRNECAQRDGQQ